MPVPPDPTPSAGEMPLRKLVLLKAGQDLRRCRDCAMCNGNLSSPETTSTMDISLDALVHMVLWNDEEVLSSKTLWSEPVYNALPHACVQGLNLQAVVSTLREVALMRGVL